MLPRVVNVVALPNYRLRIEFDDGVAGEIEILPRLSGPVFAPLHDEKLFRQVGIDEFGAVCWPNGPDLAPDAMYTRITGQSIFDAQPESTALDQRRLSK